MQRGYVLTNLNLDEIVLVNKKKKKFELVPIVDRTTLNNALCFTNITAAKSLQKRILNSFPNFPETKIINVAQLYCKIF